MAILWGKNYSRLEVLRRVGDIRQIARAEPFEMVDGSERGVRAVRLRNAGGLDLVVATDRGMSIIELAYRGIPLPFLTGVGVAHPAYSEPSGLGWLRTWPGGFLTPCGLTQVGSPCEEDGEVLGLHGRVAGVPARDVRYGGYWKDEDYYVWTEGTVRQAAMFGEDISLHRRVGMWLGGTRFWIEDTVENHSFRPVPHMFLQHFNLGFPLVDAGSRLDLPVHTTEPRDDTARAAWIVIIPSKIPNRATTSRSFTTTCNLMRPGMSKPAWQTRTLMGVAGWRSPGVIRFLTILSWCSGR